MSNNNNERYKERELGEKDPNANTEVYYEVRATALRPLLHTEGFSLSTIRFPQRDLHRGITTIQKRSTQLQLSHTSTQEGSHKVKKKVYNLVIT